ncbi:hypothetical protein ACNKHX_14365 [Shigella flexneri]
MQSEMATHRCSAVKQDNQKGLMQIKENKKPEIVIISGFIYPQRKAADDDEITARCAD